MVEEYDRKQSTKTSEELTQFFAGMADADIELGSSWDPLCDRARGGSSSVGDYDRGMVHRVTRRLSKREEIRSAARVLAALRALPRRGRDEVSWATVLVARYGPVAWARRIDDGEARGTATKVFRKLDELFGVAVVTADIAALPVELAPLPVRATKWSGGEAARPRAFLTPAERALVALCVDKRPAAATALQRVKTTARAALLSAEDAYQDARASTDPAYLGACAREAREATRQRPRVAALYLGASS